MQGKTVVVSGDTVICDALIELARDADLLVQCCFLADADLATPARQLLANWVIATSGQVGRIATQARVKTLVLTHFGADDPAMFAAIAADVRRDYAGQLILGRDLLSLTL
jgi:ribonuclease Z